MHLAITTVQLLLSDEASECAVLPLTAPDAFADETRSMSSKIINMGRVTNTVLLHKFAMPAVRTERLVVGDIFAAWLVRHRSL